MPGWKCFGRTDGRPHAAAGAQILAVQPELPTLTPTSSDELAFTATTPDTVVPAAGALIETDGAVVSAVTVALAWARPAAQPAAERAGERAAMNVTAARVDAQITARTA